MTAETRTRHPWRLRASVIAAVVVGIAFAAPTAYAAWTAQATAKGSVSAGRVTATLSGDLASVLTNAQMTTTRSVTLTNTTAGTSTQPAQTSLSLAVASGDATLASSTTLVAWPVTAAAQCTPSAAVGVGSAQSTWAAGLTLTSTLARGQSAAYCVRTTAGVAAGIASGTRSLVASASATVSVGTFRAEPPAVSGTLSTSGIYQHRVVENVWIRSQVTGQPGCMDVTGGVNAPPGTAVGIYTCHSEFTTNYWNQQFSMVDVSGQYAVLAMRAPSGTVLQATGGGVTIAKRDVGSVYQQWSPQTNGTTWQIVNLGTGMCMTAPASNGPLTMSACTRSPSQTFSLGNLSGLAPQDPDTYPGDSDAPADSDPGAIDSPPPPVAAGRTRDSLGHDSADIAEAAEPTGSGPSSGTPVSDGTAEDRVTIDGLGDDESTEGNSSADDTATTPHGEPAARDESHLRKDSTDD